MLWRKPLAFGLLFAATFTIKLLLIKADGIPRRDAVIPTTWAPLAAFSSGQPVQAGKDLALAESVFATTGGGEVEGSANDDAAESSRDYEQARIVATTSPEIDQRMRAIQILGEAPSDATLGVLLDASTYGADPLERAAAITALRRQLQRHGNDSRIRNSLQLAAAESDPVVVVLAQSALEGIDSTL